MQVLAVTSEIFPLIKTGGLADVAGALPAALAAHGVQVRTLLPGYPAVLAALEAGEAVATLEVGSLVAGRAAGLDLLVLDAPWFFARPGNPYMDGGGADWPDNAQRFAALCGAAAAVAQGVIPGWQPGALHLHDWQAALTPAYLHYAARPHPATVLTVHNLAFQGWFPPAVLGPLGLPPDSFTIDGVEYNGGVGFLKAGLRFADRITTVSPTYAHEILAPEMGMGLDGLLRSRADQLDGILNGIDTTVWDPATDALIAARYDAGSLPKRARNTAALRARLDLAPSDGPLFGAITRLTWQKGSDLLSEAIPALLAAGGQLAVLGSGDAALEAALRDAAAAHPGQIAAWIGYDETLAHLIQAGADALLVPSRFEPCGLTQLCALRYGAVPVVARVGGLADTVDAATGFVFAPVSAAAFAAAIDAAAAAFRDAAGWRARQAAGMARDVSWAAPAGAYARLFAALMRPPR